MYAALNRQNTGISRSARSPRVAAVQPGSHLLTIPTFHGIYYVPSCLEYVQELIQSERIAATCLNQRHRHYHQFLRRLFVLATEEAITPGNESIVRDLAADVRNADMLR